MSRQLYEALTRFDTFLRVERNLAPRTCEAYQYDLKHFADWLVQGERTGPKLSDIIGDDVRDYLAFLQSKHDYRSSAMCRVLSAIRQFFKFCCNRGFLKHSPAEHIHNPKKPKKLPVFLIESDLKRLIGAPAPDDGIGARDFCLLALMAMTGVRLKELVGLNCADVSLETRTIKVFGKGRKERLIPLNDLAVQALNAWLRIRPESADPALFLNRFGRRLSGRMVEKLVRKYCAQAGISQKGVTPHKLRHTFATLLHVKDVELLEIQSLMGHASIVSTEIYTHTNTRRLQSAVDRIALAG